MDEQRPFPDEDPQAGQYGMSLHVLAYNLKRVMKILAAEVLMAEMRG